MRDAFTEAQTRTIVAHMTTDPEWSPDTDRGACLLLTIALGCRIGEAVELRPCDVYQDAERGGWVVNFNADPDPDGTLRGVKTGASARTVPLPACVQAAVLVAKARNASAFRLFKAIPGKLQRHRVKSMSADFLALRKACGIEARRGMLTTHSWRHRMGNLCEDWSPREQKTYLGHARGVYGTAKECAALRVKVDALVLLGAV